MSESNTPVPPPIGSDGYRAVSNTAGPPPSGQEFYRSALKALNGLFDLSVTTAIGHVKQVTINETDRAVTTVELDDSDAKVANTVINTITGDTTVVYTGDFAGNAELMAMHKDALDTAQRIRSRNDWVDQKGYRGLRGPLERKDWPDALMADTWTERILTIRDALLTLEVNTLVSDVISAEKMPEVPLALHSLVQSYSGYLATADFPVTTGLLAKATMRAGSLADCATATGAKSVLRQLEFWPFRNRAWTEAELLARQHVDGLLAADDSDPATEFTNGAETFESLQWAAWAASQHARAGGSFRNHCERAILVRIYANCRQLKEAAMRLEQVDLNRGAEAVRKRLLDSLFPVAATEGQPTKPQLFGATVEETARSLFEHPRPFFRVDPDVTILIRKAWDLGTDKVCMQTVMQIDGDILQVLGDMKEADRLFLSALHRDSVRDGVGQWRALFDVLLAAARDLLGAVGRAV